MSEHIRVISPALPPPHGQPCRRVEMDADNVPGRHPVSPVSGSMSVCPRMGQRV